jgi:hypothetical protein
MKDKCIYCGEELRKTSASETPYCNNRGDTINISHCYKKNVYIDFYIKDFSIKVNIDGNDFHIFGTNFDFIKTSKSFDIEEIKKIIKLYPLLK